METSNQVVIIKGASKGLGRELALAFAGDLSIGRDVEKFAACIDLEKWLNQYRPKTPLSCDRGFLL